MNDHRFNDQKKRLDDFDDEIWVHCPKCQKQAFCHKPHGEPRALLRCSHCGQQQTQSTLISNHAASPIELILPAHLYFKAELWFSKSFKGNEFWAYNPKHLDYLEHYIAAKLREHKNRTHTTLLEKLPDFYHSKKNRTELLKLIKQLKLKSS